MKVLVVDDEPSVRQFVCTILRRNGFEAVDAQDGLEALEVAAQHRCDVVITDCVMPGISGPQLVAQLKERHYPAKYLLISGYSSQEVDSDLPFLSKPFTEAQLLDAIQRLKEAAPGIAELKRETEQARAEWLKSIKEQEEIISEVPTELPGTDGIMFVEKAGIKRKAAYLKYMDALQKYRYSSGSTQPGSAEPEDFSPDESSGL